MLNDSDREQLDLTAMTHMAAATRRCTKSVIATSQNASKYCRSTPEIMDTAELKNPFAVMFLSGLRFRNPYQGLAAGAHLSNKLQKLIFADGGREAPRLMHLQIHVHKSVQHILDVPECHPSHVVQRSGESNQARPCRQSSR